MIQQQKKNMRLELKEKRQAIDPERRSQAESEALEALLSIVRPYRFVMSYESFGDELCTKGVNHILEEEGKLVLPKVIEGKIKAFHVTDSSNGLEDSSLGMREPLATCQEVDPQEIGLIFVPGLGFDTQKQRIGYGKGHYDRFLKTVGDEAITVGIGFREQFSAKNFPVEDTDQSLTTILLF